MGVLGLLWGEEGDNPRGRSKANLETSWPRRHGTQKLIQRAYADMTTYESGQQEQLSSKTKGPGEEGAAEYCPKILLPKGPKWCSVLSIGVIGRSALEIGHFLR